MNNHEDDNESITSLLSESEDETEIKPVKLKSKQIPTNKSKENLAPPIEEREISKKTGKPKRIQSEAQKQNLVKARVKARAVRKEMSELRKAEKDLKKDALMMRRLEVEAKILSHEEQKKKLFVSAGYIDEKDANLKKEKKKKAPAGTKDLLEIEAEENQVKELEEKLTLLKTKKTKKKVITPDISSAEASEEENEIISPPTPPPKIKRSSIQKPIMETKPKRVEASNPMARQVKKPQVDDAMRAQLLSLFPNYQF